MALKDWLAPLLAGTAALTASQAQASMAQASVHRLHCLEALGTSLDLVAVGGDRAMAETALQAALAEVARLDAVLSGWREDSELVRLSRGEPVDISPDLHAVTAAAETWRARTGGAFDARYGLDGIAKGYVIDQALAAARAAAPGLKGLLLDIGGDLAVWGEGPSGAWRVGAADPARLEDNAEPAATLKLISGAVASSGRGERGTLHFRDGRPATEVVSATAVAGCAADADALSTALMVMPPRRGLALVEAIPGAEARLVDSGGRVHTSSGWVRLASDAPAPRLIRVAAAPATAPWPQGFEVRIDYQPLKPAKPPAYAPYISIWVTDAAGRLVRQLLLQGDDLNYIDQNYVWWRRYGRSAPKVIDATAKPTRPAGRYSAVWDGKDQSGQLVGQGRYTIHIEAIREHGSHTYQAVALELGAAAVEGQGTAGEELGPSRVRYGRK